MNILYLIAIIGGISAQDILKKPFTKKQSNKGVFFFGALTALFALFFFLFGGVEKPPLGLLPYCIGFGGCYALSIACSVAAIECGPLSLTALINSYSLMLPTLYGLIFLKDPIGKGFIGGLGLLALSLFLVRGQKDAAPLSLRWAAFAALAFLGNGMCSVVQKMQQVAFEGAYKNELMVGALLIVVMILGALSLTKERKELKENLKAGWYLAPLCGIANGLVNLFVMILSGKMAVALMFPLISAGGLLLTFFFAVFIYKEKLAKRQFLGFALGLGAVILLNI